MRSGHQCPARLIRGQGSANADLTALAVRAVSTSDAGFAVEPTMIGLQSLVPGIVPITIAARLAARAAAPLEPAKPQRPCDLGLFDFNARNQLDLFQPKDL